MIPYLPELPQSSTDEKLVRSNTIYWLGSVPSSFVSQLPYLTHAQLLLTTLINLCNVSSLIRFSDSRRNPYQGHSRVVPRRASSNQSPAPAVPLPIRLGFYFSSPLPLSDRAPHFDLPFPVWSDLVSLGWMFACMTVWGLLMVCFMQVA